MADLDNILSGREVASETNEQEQVSQVAEGEGQQQEAQGNEAEPQGQKTVPHEALHAEKQKVKRYTEEVSEFRRSNESLQRQVTELLQRIPVPKVEQAPRPDFFENPEAATQHTVQQSVSPQFEQINQQLLAIARDNAETRFTPETVNDAEKAFITAMQSKALDPADYQKVISSPNRYTAAVQWFKRQQAQAEIGDDPAAFRAKVEAEILAKHGITPGEQQPAQQHRPPVMPSNLAGARNVGARSGPAWSGPSSLQDIFNRTPSSG
jgi:hypothetical protein